MMSLKLSDLRKSTTFRFLNDQNDQQTYTYLGRVRMYDRWGRSLGWGFSYIKNDDSHNRAEQILEDTSVEIIKLI